MIMCALCQLEEENCVCAARKAEAAKRYEKTHAPIANTTRDIRRQRAREHYERKRGAGFTSRAHYASLERVSRNANQEVISRDLNSRLLGATGSAREVNLPPVSAHSAEYFKRHPELLAPGAMIDMGMLAKPVVDLPDLPKKSWRDWFGRKAKEVEKEKEPIGVVLDGPSPKTYAKIVDWEDR